MKKEILITVINYQCEQEVLEYCRNIEKLSYSEKIFISIVNNKESEDGNNLSDLISELKIDHLLCDPKDNLGYLNGCLFGVEKFKEAYGYVPKWVIVSNTDISIHDNDFFVKFLDNDYEEDIWCVCPSVISKATLEYSNPHAKERLTKKRIKLMIRVFSSSFLHFLFRAYRRIFKKKNKGIKQESQYVYSAHGCFFILKDEFIQNLDGEKYGAFLYSEESYIGEKILLANKKVYYDSNIELEHLENLSTGKLNRKRRNKMIVNSLKYILDNFYKEEEK